MSKIYFRQLASNAYLLDGCNLLSNRQAMKLNIFLNSQTDIALQKKADSIMIEYINAEEHIVSKSIFSIINHLKNQACDVALDEGVSQLVGFHLMHQNETAITLETLRAVRGDDANSQFEFQKFCSYCDLSLRIKLLPYQYRAAFLLSIGKGGFDFSVPGSGKTIITYAAYSYLKDQSVIENMLVIGPGSAYNAWYEEYYTCFGNNPDFENLADASINECKLYLNTSANHHKEISFVNFEKLRLVCSDMRQFLSNRQTLLVVDEAHKIKNPSAAVTCAVHEVAKYANARILLTGTPMPNGFEDLYSLAKTYSPYDDILPFSYSQLQQMSKGVEKQAQANRLRRALKPYYSRISKSFLIESSKILPPIYHMVACDMETSQADLYNKLNAFYGKIHEDVDEDILASFKKAILIRKMQISANPALLKKSLINSMDELRLEYSSSACKDNLESGLLIKADRDVMHEFSSSDIVNTISKYEKGEINTAKNLKVVEIAKRLVDGGQKVLIWDIFVKNMDVIKELLEISIDTKVEMVNGLVTGYDRQSAIKRFRDGDSMILLANPATLAESISLHRACQNSIYVNRNYNAAQYIQSKDRIHRINMPVGSTATYYILFNKDTVDVCVDERLSLKENRMVAILDADDIVVGGAELEESEFMSTKDVDYSFER